MEPLRLANISWRSRLVAPLLGFTLALLAACSGPPIFGPSYLDGHPAFATSELVHVVIEIPAGTNAKWEVAKPSGELQWEHVDGVPRVVHYLAYPANYGMIPRTSLPLEMGGDGDPLDAIVLGPQVERGSVLRVRPIGVLQLIDDGERDDKILAVRTSGPFSEVADLTSLEAEYPGALSIVETWFTNYKGRARTRVAGHGDAATAREVIREASRYYERAGAEAE